MPPAQATETHRLNLESSVAEPDREPKDLCLRIFNLCSEAATEGQDLH